MSTAVTSVRRDETLYSALARVGWLLGGTRRTALQLALFGADMPVFDDMPVGLDRVVASGVFGDFDIVDAAREWTLFPYYAHYASPAHARAVMNVMAHIDDWPHAVLGSWAAAAPPADRLRFCVSCCNAMAAGGAGLWWRRAHQLPSALVCPDHREPLRDSLIDREARRRGYVVASYTTCPADAPAVVEVEDPRVLADLVHLARQSDVLLNGWDEVHPDDRREGYLEDLHRLGLLNRRGEANLPALAKAMDGYWGTTLDLWPSLRRDGRCMQRWLGGLMLREHRSPPLHHLLLEGLLYRSWRD
ncbi:MAG: hypothetical protein A4S12_00615 [Proteobacteria bacterium SG_bin5]|nr:MAG: hypothetical protein A4S12_00615 [Proteobacteria bacterium SG_bin5]